MTFPEYAQGLRPFCSYGLKTEVDFFTALIGNFIKTAAMDGCVLLRHKPDTQYRYYIGSKPILPKNAKYGFLNDVYDPDDQLLGQQEEVGGENED